MFLRTEHGGVTGRKMIHIYACDHCTREFVPKKGRTTCRYSFCCRACSHASQRSGVRRDSTIDNLRNAFHEYCRSKGVENVSQLDDVKKKVIATNMRRHGSPAYTGSPEWRSKTITTMRAKHGVDWFTQSDEFKERSKATNMLHRGVEFPRQSRDVLAKIDWRAAALKRHVTMKRNGSYLTSRREESFYDALRVLYDGDIQRHVIVNGWNIDFFIASCDTFVQFDGVYWHGLDRSDDEILQFKSPRDRTIFATKLRDCEQVKWFGEQSLKLVRVTDYEFQSMTSDELKAKLERKQRSTKERKQHGN